MEATPTCSIEYFSLSAEVILSLILFMVAELAFGSFMAALRLPFKEEINWSCEALNESIPSPLSLPAPAIALS
jgi:hypothetical protein